MAVPADAALKSLYYVMQSIEVRAAGPSPTPLLNNPSVRSGCECTAQAKLGGGEGIEGMYGSIKRLGMHKVIEALAEHCNLSSKSHFLDVGAGIGRCVQAKLLNMLLLLLLLLLLLGQAAPAVRAIALA